VKAALAVLFASLALAPAAAAQVPTTPAPQPPAPQPPAPQPAAAKVTVSVDGFHAKGKTYVVAGQKLTATGTISPYVAGQKVVVEMLRKGKPVARRTVTVKKGKGNAGAFKAVFRARRSGVFAVRARHDANAAQAGAKSKRVRFIAFKARAGSGSSGVKVKLLQKGLAQLGYVTSRSGRFDDATGRAVLAFRKVNNMSRKAYANRAVFTEVLAGKGTFKLRYPRAGKHVEFDWSKQVLALAEGGRAVRIYHASSGKGSTPTVFGTFSFYRKQPGTNSLGMVDSNYFIRGYAIHGYHEVPTYPASHGCIRVPIPNAASIDRWIKLGDRIFVYR
jgi:hypothetical protein